MLALFEEKKELDVKTFLNDTSIELCHDISASQTHITVDLQNSRKHINSFVKAAIVRNGLKM